MRIIKKYFFNKIFNENVYLKSKADTAWEEGLLMIAKKDYNPLIKKNGIFGECSKSFILHALRYSVDYYQAVIDRKNGLVPLKREGCYCIMNAGQSNDKILTFLRKANKILAEINEEAEDKT